MAGDWIKVENTTPDKPEVVKMADVLGIDQDAVVGKLVRLWIWADENSIDGNGVSVTDLFIDRLTFQKGFALALRNVGWLTGKNSCLMLPNFDRHNGQTSKDRANTNRRVAKHRASCNGDGVTTQLQKPLPEKSRVEHNRRGVVNNTVDGAAAVPLSPTSPQGNDDLLARTRSFIRACCSINSAWGKTRLNRFESVAAADAYNGGAVSARDVELIAAYYRSKMAMDSRKVAFWRPDGRLKFFECFGDVIAHAVRWARETSWKSFAEMEGLKAAREAKAGAESGDKGEAVSLEEFRAALAGGEMGDGGAL